MKIINWICNAEPDALLLQKAISRIAHFTFITIYNPAAAVR